MARFNLLKTLGIEKLLNRAMDGFKRDVVRELDRASDKLATGQTATEVIGELHKAVSKLLASGRLGGPVGALLAGALMMIPWDQLLRMPNDAAINELARIRKQVESARL